MTPRQTPAAPNTAPPSRVQLRGFLRRPLLGVLGFSLIINLTLLAPSLFMMQVYDRVLVTRSVETLLMLGGAATLTLLAMGVLEQVRSRMLAVTGTALERCFGPHVLTQLVIASARGGGSVYQEGMRDLSTLRSFVSGPAVIALCDVPWTPVYLLLIAAFDLRLGLLALVAALLLMALTWAQDRASAKGLTALREQTRITQRVAERSLQNAELLTALGMTGEMATQWRQQLDLQHAEIHAGARHITWFSASIRTFRQLVQVLMLGCGAWLVIHEGATPGLTIACTVILARALSPVEQLIAQWRLLGEARSALTRLDDLLARPEEASAATALPRPTGALSVESLSCRAPGSGDRLLLRQVSFTADAGSIVAVVGGSGAGKTTLARLLVGVLRPAGGSVRLDGADIRQWDPQQLGPAMGYLPQDVELFAGSVAENIARFTNAPSDAVIAAATAAHAHEFIVRLPKGYDTPIGEGGAALSGGQRQRVALARALFNNPALIVLDEPDASLDSEGEDALMAALAGAKLRGATVVAVTQRRRILSIADKVIVLKEGTVERTAVRSEAGEEAVAVGGRDQR